MCRCLRLPGKGVVILKTHLLPCTETRPLLEVRPTYGISQGDRVVHRLCGTGAEVRSHNARSIANENRSIEERLRSLVVHDCLGEGFTGAVNNCGEIFRDLGR